MRKNIFFLIDPDIEYKKVATLDNHITTFNWTEEMSTEEGGSFEITLGDGALMPILKKELIIQNTKGKKLGFITTIQYKKDKGAIKEIKIKGKMLEYILTRRHVKNQMQLQGTAEQIITDLVNINVINTKNTILNIPMELRFKNLPSDTLEYGFEDGKKVSEALKEICGNLILFYYFEIENGKLILNIQKCEDKPYMIFASDDSNIYDVVIYDTIENKANCVIVKGDFVNNSVPYSYSVLSGKSGIHVSEEFIDKSDLDSKDVESSIYLKMLKQTGNNQLMNYQIMKLFDSCTMKNKYTYPTEIFLGDVVSVDIDNEKQRQRLVSFLHCMNSNNKEELIFTLAQMPELITSENEYIFDEIPPEQRPGADSDASTENANPNGGGGGISGQPVKIVGHILCIDNDKIRGTVQEIEKDIYRINIYAWNDNATTVVTNEDGTETAVQQVAPFYGKIYVPCDIDLLSKITNTTRTIDIDNFDGSKTRINVDNARKGVLFIDEADPDGPPLFEMPTEANADKQMCWEYDIESENLNFNFSSIISEKPVRDTIKTKMYAKSYPTPLKSMVHYFRFTMSGYQTYRTDFIPSNFYADDGDYIEFYCMYAPIHHELDKNGKTVIRWYEEETEKVLIRHDFRTGEIVANRRIRWDEGFYCFRFFDGSGENARVTSNFKKINYLKSISAGGGNDYLLGNTEMKTFNRETEAIGSTTAFGFAVIKLDPAFDVVDDLKEVTWVFRHFGSQTEILTNRFTEVTDWKNMKNEPVVYIMTDCSKYNSTSPLNLLENLCRDPATWQKILDEEAAAATE